MMHKIKSKEILNSIKETCESSSIHAIPNITKNKYYSIKLVWLVCFLISTAFCGYSIFNSLVDYFQYNVVTKMVVEKANKLIFPIITISAI